MKRSLLAMCLLAAIALVAGCAGTGDPWTKTVRIVVVGLTTDGTAETPIPGATVTLTASAGSGTGGPATPPAQTLTTDSSGSALFRVTPGFVYTANASASGYSASTVTINVTHLAGSITRKLLLAASSG